MIEQNPTRGLEQLFLQSSMPMAVAAWTANSRPRTTASRTFWSCGRRRPSSGGVFDLASPCTSNTSFRASGRCCEVRNRSLAAGRRSRATAGVAITLLRPACCGGAGRTRRRRPAAARGWLMDVAEKWGAATASRDLCVAEDGGGAAAAA